MSYWIQTNFFSGTKSLILRTIAHTSLGDLLALKFARKKTEILKDICSIIMGKNSIRLRPMI